MKPNTFINLAAKSHEEIGVKTVMLGNARGVKGCGDVTPGNGHRQLWPPTKIDLPTSTPDGKIDDPAAASNFTALAQCFNRRLGGAWRHALVRFETQRQLMRFWQCHLEHQGNAVSRGYVEANPRGTRPHRPISRPRQGGARPQGRRSHR